MMESDIGLKQADKDKLKSLSLELELLEGKASRFRELKESSSALRKSIDSHPAPKTRENLEARLSDLKVRLGRLESETTRDKESISQLKGAVDGFRKKAEELINSSTDRRIRVA